MSMTASPAHFRAGFSTDARTGEILHLWQKRATPAL